jgi:ribonuclease H / adenosylcobalamin/alpha-ribazole phosphatase
VLAHARGLRRNVERDSGWLETDSELDQYLGHDPVAMSAMHVKAFAKCDGSGNSPKGSSCAAIVFDPDSGEILAQEARRIWKCSNNIAEYMGAALAIELAKQLGVVNLTIHSDSQLIVNQIMGRWRVKDQNLLAIRRKLIPVIKTFDHFEIKWIPRERNKDADAMCTEIISSLPSAGAVIP